MADRIAPKFAVCPSAELADGEHRKLTMTFEGREEECLLLRFEGQIAERGDLVDVSSMILETSVGRGRWHAWSGARLCGFAETR
ncbi:MAG: Rieske (2Fe-2S) region, partial [Rhodocyclaceae bacterium]